MSDIIVNKIKLTPDLNLKVLGYKHGSSALRHKLLSLGLVPGALCKIIRLAPMGDPIQLLVRGGILSIRRAEFEMIEMIPA